MFSYIFGVNKSPKKLIPLKNLKCKISNMFSNHIFVQINPVFPSISLIHRAWPNPSRSKPIVIRADTAAIVHHRFHGS